MCVNIYIKIRVTEMPQKNKNAHRFFCLKQKLKFARAQIAYTYTEDMGGRGAPRGPSGATMSRLHSPRERPRFPSNKFSERSNKMEVKAHVTTYR